MSEFKVGQRVRLLGAEVEIHQGSSAAPGQLWVTSDDYGDDKFRVPTALLETIIEPVQVGDAITSVDQLDTLPDESVIVAHGGRGLAAQKHQDEWRAVGLQSPFDAAGLAKLWNARVVHIPESA